MKSLRSTIYFVCLLLGPGMAYAQQPFIFNSMETAVPGEAFGLQGDGFGNSPQLWISIIKGDEKRIQPSRQIPVLSGSAVNISAVLPSDPHIKPGSLIAVWVRNGKRLSSPVFLNRARAVTLEFDELMPGQPFRIFGRNLKLSKGKPLVQFRIAGQKPLPAQYLSGDAYCLSLRAPQTLQPGARYQIWLSNGNGGSLGWTKAGAPVLARALRSDPFDLKAAWGTDFTFYRNRYNVKTDSRLKIKAHGDGLANDRSTIQQAIDRAASDGGGVVYLPAGTYKLEFGSGTGLTMRSRVVLQGDGLHQTKIQYGFGTPPPYDNPIGKSGWPDTTTNGVAILWPLNTTLTGLYALQIQNVNTSGLWKHSLKNMPSPNPAPGSGGSKFFVSHCRFDLGVAWGLSWGHVDRMAIISSEFESHARNTWPWQWHCNGATNFIVRDNQVCYAAGRFGFNESDQGIIENNHIVRLGDEQMTKGESGGFNIDYAADIVIQNNHMEVAGKAIDNRVNNNQGETILSQGGNPLHQDAGRVSRAAAGSISDDAGKWKYQIRTASLGCSDAVAIIAGKGAGQWRFIRSNTANTILVEKNWDVVPDSTSYYVIMRWSARDWLVRNNTLEGNHRGIWFYCGNTQVAIVGNRLINSDGIYVRSDQRISAQLGRYNLAWNTLISGNSVINRDGMRPAYINSSMALGIPYYLYGIGTIGLEIRNNYVEAHQPNSRAFIQGEGYFNEVVSQKPAVNTQTAILGTIFEGNTVLNADIAYKLSSNVSQTVIKGPVNRNVKKNSSDTLAPRSGTGQTIWLNAEDTLKRTAIVPSTVPDELSPVIMSADWQLKGMLVVLKDELQHPRFSWPLTLLHYRLKFGAAGFDPATLKVSSVSGNKPLLFQLSDIGKQEATLNILTDLRSGADQSFRIEQAKETLDNADRIAHKTNEGILLDNGRLRLLLPAGGTQLAAPILRYGDKDNWLGSGEFPGADGFEELKVKELAAGPLYSACQLDYFFSGGRHYQLNLRLVKGMEFAEIEERMTGFDAGSKLSWRMIWNGLKPDHRYCPGRGEVLPGLKAGTKPGFNEIRWESMEGLTTGAAAAIHPGLRIDQQNDAEGKLPFSLAPYDNWISWWNLPVSAFWDEHKKLTVGLFIKDTEKWNDGKYALWTSLPGLGIDYHWRDQQLDFTFPLSSGTRSTAIAAYDHNKDIGLVNQTGRPFLYVDDLRRWYGWLSLDKTKNWVLNYPDPESGYPKYFKAANIPRPSINALEQNLNQELNSLASGSERNMGPTPVGTRTYYEKILPAFDVLAPQMSPARFKQLRAWELFMNEVFMDEALMPVRTMLSGHPNFLADIKGVPGMNAVLFPHHPHAQVFADHFEKSVALNFNYHIRPQVDSWGAKGGRWTENLSTYLWAALKPTVRTSALMHHYYDGRNRLAQPGVSMLGDYILNTMTSPVEAEHNRRLIPPQGAHSNVYGNVPPDILRQMGQELMYFDPMLAEHLLWATRATDEPFESQGRSGAWADVLKGEFADNPGTAPQLRSAKYTGYGVVLRSGFGTPEETYINLQQIDEGPNYRWGRAAEGGNGVIYYYAGGKRYSHNGQEDVGDGPFGDVERVTNFGIKKAPGYRQLGPYRSVGRNELTEPLYNFGIAQLATLKANAGAAPYRSRSVLQSGGDYIVVYDQVDESEQEGRFSWFTGRDDDFPVILQLKPGAPAMDADVQPSQSNYHKDPALLPTKGRYYDGKGSFLTLVTHKPGINAVATPYGCEVHLPDGQTDHVFRNASTVHFERNGQVFEGTAGLIRPAAAALFEGTVLGLPGIRIELKERAGVSMESTAGGYRGNFQSQQPATLVFTFDQKNAAGMKGAVFYLDGQAISRTGSRISVKFPAGKHTWQYTAAYIPEPAEIVSAVVKSEGLTLYWQPVAGSLSYQPQISHDGGTAWANAGPPVRSVSSIQLGGLKNGEKIHLRLITTGAGGAAEPSAAYPVYVTALAPHAPEGLLVNKGKISWGAVPGAGKYQLYRRVRGAAFRRIYLGEKRSFTDREPDSQVWEYAVTASNGNGESVKSTISDTDSSRLINWQPPGAAGFRRDTRNHENGYTEYNSFTEQNMPVLTYPKNK